MHSPMINNNEDLSLRILQLKHEKQMQEIELKVAFTAITETLNPVKLIKNSLHDIVTDKVVKDDLLKIGLNLGTNFIIEKVMRRGSLKGYLSSVVLETISSSLINSGTLTGIIDSISRMMTKESSSKTD